MIDEDKKKKKEYEHMMRNTKRKLKKAAEEFGCWDEGYLFDFMRIIFECWRDYYHIGWNVSAMENREWNEEAKDQPTREEIAKELLRLMDDIDNYWREDAPGETNSFDKRNKAFFDYMAKYIHFMWD